MEYHLYRANQQPAQVNMVLSGVPLIVQRTFSTLLFKFARFLFTTVQQVAWKLNGTAQLATEARQPENYSRSAHVLDIVAQHQFDILHTFAIEDFICTHNRFESPGYVLDNDHISLLTINDTDAIFVEAKHEGQLLWKSEFSPFIRNSQVENCRRLIVVPLPAFHRMSEELGDPKGQLVFLFNTGRCGSTLLTHMLEHTGVCVAVSEPDAAQILTRWYRRRGDSESLRQVTRDCVRWLCRPYKAIKPTTYVVKISGTSSCAAPILTTVFPDSRCVYVYRNVVPMAQSAYRASCMLPSLGLTYILGKHSARLTEMAVNMIGFPGMDYRFRLYDNLTFGVLLLIRTALPYLELRRRGFPVVAVRYEDIVADPEYVFRRLLEFCGIPASLATAGLDTMKIDSSATRRCRGNCSVDRRTQN